MNIIKKVALHAVAVSAIGLVVFAGQALAQDEQKVYSYDSIDVKIAVNPDSTFTVEERQLFNYEQGIFHQGWRSIPLNSVSRITDILVTDGETGQVLQYSPRRLDKTDPDDWGKYTYYKERGSLNIEWYYSLSDTKHLWTVQYVVHGGLEFYPESDRLYWNLFSNYDVPIGFASATVAFPAGVSSEGIKFYAYRTAAQDILKETRAGEGIHFETSRIKPGEAFTIDIAFPKGIVQESAFWKDWLVTNYGYVGSGAIVLLGALFLLAYWYRTERHGKGRGVIIAQYEPPQQLRPAMAEVLVKETITAKAWPATIVDLAVRGFIAIKEEQPGKLESSGWVLVLIFFVVASGSIGFALVANDAPSSLFALFGIGVIAVVVLVSWASAKKGSVQQVFMSKSYAIEKTKEYAGDPSLEEYEKKFLDIIFSGGPIFSLKAIKRSPPSQKELARLLDELKQELYAETDKDTKAFEYGMSKGKYLGYVMLGILFAFFILAKAGRVYFENQAYILTITTIVVATFIIAFIKFEPRLSNKGHLLREDWLGFKLYLETAERYRLQNLTPELFERYLPYAMIFGIEKKWARSFEGVSMQPPMWYGASHVGMAAGVSSGASFSPVTFSSSFTSSFTSAFASSGGGGGGGSAGGGGGGGGGGAS